MLYLITEAGISRAIYRSALADLIELSSVDVAIAGAGPSGLTASYYLAKSGFKVLVFEKSSSFGGGIGSGGNMLPKVVFQEEALPLLREFNVRYREAGEGLYTVDPAELIAKLAYNAVEAGVKIILGSQVVDVVYRVNPLRVAGVMWVWSPIQASGAHVDPLFTEARAVVDATGHEAEVVSIAARRLPELGIKVVGEKSAYAELSEKLVVEYTGRVAPGLYATGVAVCKIHGLPRMGPIFGGMLLSGKKVAEIIASDLR